MSGSIKRRWSARSIGAGQAGSPSLPLLPIIGAWLLAYFFKGALIRVPPPFLWPFGSPPTLISRRKDGIGALPCPEVVPSPHHAILGLPRLTARAALPPPTATASRPICKFDCPWSTGLLASLGRHIFKDAGVWETQKCMCTNAKAFQFRMHLWYTRSPIWKKLLTAASMQCTLPQRESRVVDV